MGNKRKKRLLKKRQRQRKFWLYSVFFITILIAYGIWSLLELPAKHLRKDVAKYFIIENEVLMHAYYGCGLGIFKVSGYNPNFLKTGNSIKEKILSNEKIDFYEENVSLQKFSPKEKNSRYKSSFFAEVVDCALNAIRYKSKTSEDRRVSKQKLLNGKATIISNQFIRPMILYFEDEGIVYFF